ncbi:amino acid permease [Moorella sulfitireducens]|uniref:amino acid permease n=1 Tax=Neomoorella sulfitireducens TaxID=2972948 RepID=UPI0021AC15A5|nr:amino acid permease [Moorella sulfitireducens]
MAEPTMFVRKASGLVRAWSVFDGFIYATFSINLITLGLYIFSFAPFLPEAHLVPAIIISSLLILAEVVVYGMLVAIMPRAGGDYVWQSRVLGGGPGFVLAITGWVFILWHWVPIYGTILAYEVFTPILAVLGGWTGSPGLVRAAMWFSDKNGLFFSSIIVIALAFLFVSAGMKWYARIQKACFFIGAAGLLLAILVLLDASQAQFITGFNHYATTFLGAPGNNLYQEIMQLASKEGYTPVAWHNMSFSASLSLIPMVVFWNLWPNWGATLYGEVRGAGDFKRNFWSMAAGLLITAALAIILLALFAKTFGWEFYHALNYDFFSGKSPFPVYPYPGLLVAFLINNPLLQLLLLVTLSAWFFGWCGTVFLSSTRVVFAAAFDRVLPEWVARVSPRTRAPINALLLMAIPATIISLLNSYLPGFSTYTLDATVVIAITYLGTTVAAILLPYKDKELFQSSPVARYKIFGIPWICVSGVIFLIFLCFNLYKWITDSVYGVNSPTSAVYMLVLYALSVAIYFGSKWFRRRQGIDLDMVYKNIPVE